jgi:hypothetical protein
MSLDDVSDNAAAEMLDEIDNYTLTSGTTRENDEFHCNDEFPTENDEFPRTNDEFPTTAYRTDELCSEDMRDGRPSLQRASQLESIHQGRETYIQSYEFTSFQNAEWTVDLNEDVTLYETPMPNRPLNSPPQPADPATVDRNLQRLRQRWLQPTVEVPGRTRSIDANSTVVAAPHALLRNIEGRDDTIQSDRGFVDERLFAFDEFSEDSTRPPSAHSIRIADEDDDENLFDDSVNYATSRCEFRSSCVEWGSSEWERRTSTADKTSEHAPIKPSGAPSHNGRSRRFSS